MSTGEPELLSTGPEDGTLSAWRRDWDRAVAAAVGGGVVGRATAPQPAPSSQPRASAAAGSAVVVPEVVAALTLPGSGGLLVRPVQPGPDGATYDYNLTG